MIKISVAGERQRSSEGLGWAINKFMSELFVLSGSNHVRRRREL